jgi:two-component sensor histidine kinase
MLAMNYNIIYFFVLLFLIISFIFIIIINKNNKLKQENNFIKMNSLEKEKSIKEANHRIKNNLQLINSLMNYQAVEYKSKDIDGFILKGQKRINSIILLHQNFDITNGKNNTVNFSKYISDLFDFFKEIFQMEHKNILFEMDVNNIDLNMETALPLGIILNELISNSLIHAFPVNDSNNKIKIALTRHNKNKYNFIYEDNGIGFLKTTKDGLGFKIIEMLSKQLNAEYIFESKDGFKFNITFYSQYI